MSTTTDLSLTPSPDYVIVTSAYGGLDVTPATLAEAMSLFDSHKSCLARDILKIAELDWAACLFVSPRKLAELLLNVAKGQPDVEVLRSLLHGARPVHGEDMRPEVALNPQCARDVMAWFWQSHPNMPLDALAGWLIKDIDSLLDALPWLEPMRTRARAAGQELVLADSDQLHAAREYRIITKARWKHGAPEHGVVRRILAFTREYLVDRSDWRHLEVRKITPSAS